MSNSKKDFLIVLKLLLDLVNNLSEDQFNNLVNGSADIKYFEKGIDSEKKEIYNNILYKLAKEKNSEKKIELITNSSDLSTKSKLIDFCKYFKVEFRVKDTNSVIIKRILNFVDENEEDIIYRFNKLECIEENVDEIAKKLENIMDVEEARTLILNSKSLKNKTNLLKLSKKLNVFIDRESSYEIIVDTIIKSVVEAKIRSYTIRKKI